MTCGLIEPCETLRMRSAMPRAARISYCPAVIRIGSSDGTLPAFKKYFLFRLTSRRRRRPPPTNC